MHSSALTSTVNTMFRRFVIVKFALLLMSGMSATAQFQPGQWVEDMYIVDLFSSDYNVSKLFIDEKNDIQLQIPHIKTSVDFPIDSKYLSRSYDLFWYDDAIYTIARGDDEKNEDGSLFTRWTFAKWQKQEEQDGGGEWHFIGDFKTDTRTSLRAIPCRDNRFIVVSNRDLRGDYIAGRTPFHRMSVRSARNEVAFDNPIDHGMDDLEQFMSDQTCFELAYNSYIIMTDEYATLVHRRTGLYWVFSLEKASLVKAGMIFRQLKPEIIAGGGFPDAIFRVNPEKNGTVLLSAQEEGYLTSETLDPIHEIIRETKNLSWDAVQKLQAERTKQLAERNPFIVWYRIYPENGRIEKLSTAPEGGDDIRSLEEPAVVWRPMPDGTVKMGNVDRLIIDSYAKKPEETTK